MENFNDRIFMEVFSRGNYEKYVGEFVLYMYWENGDLISYANVVTDRVVEIELLNVRTGHYDIIGMIRGDVSLRKDELFDGMEQLVRSRLHLYV